MRLSSLSATAALGEWLARNLVKYGSPALLLHGPLGSGKTALTCGIVRKLPGGEDAELSSPSFTICNHYPTQPPSLHCDLYRCQALPEDAAELAYSGKVQLFVEWAEFLPEEDLPEEFLDISFRVLDETRILELSAHGSGADKMLAALLHDWEPAPHIEAWARS